MKFLNICLVLLLISIIDFKLIVKADDGDYYDDDVKLKVTNALDDEDVKHDQTTKHISPDPVDVDDDNSHKVVSDEKVEVDDESKTTLAEKQPENNNYESDSLNANSDQDTSIISISNKDEDSNDESDKSDKHEHVIHTTKVNEAENVEQNHDNVENLGRVTTKIEDELPKIVILNDNNEEQVVTTTVVHKHDHKHDQTTIKSQEAEKKVEIVDNNGKEEKVVSTAALDEQTTVVNEGLHKGAVVAELINDVASTVVAKTVTEAVEEIVVKTTTSHGILVDAIEGINKDNEETASKTTNESVSAQDLGQENAKDKEVAETTKHEIVNEKNVAKTTTASNDIFVNAIKGVDRDKIERQSLTTKVLNEAELTKIIESGNQDEHSHHVDHDESKTKDLKITTKHEVENESEQHKTTASLQLPVGAIKALDKKNDENEITTKTIAEHPTHQDDYTKIENENDDDDEDYDNNKILEENDEVKTTEIVKIIPKTTESLSKDAVKVNPNITEKTRNQKYDDYHVDMQTIATTTNNGLIRGVFVKETESPQKTEKPEIEEPEEPELKFTTAPVKKTKPVDKTVKNKTEAGKPPADIVVNENEKQLINELPKIKTVVKTTMGTKLILIIVLTVVCVVFVAVVVILVVVIIRRRRNVKYVNNTNYAAVSQNDRI